MNLRKRLILAAKAACCKESVESSADMIADNTVPSFDSMGMANVAPGEFAQDEITDKENLVNRSFMSNDNNFNSETNIDSFEDIANKMMNDMLDISDNTDEVASVEIITEPEDECKGDEECCHGHHCDYHHRRGLYGESSLMKELKRLINETTVFTGPKDWNPDTRISVSEVLQTLKNEIGEGSEAIHVDQEYDKEKDNCYKVSQIDKNKLPKTLTVSNVKLKLDGDTYYVDTVSDSYPVIK